VQEKMLVKSIGEVVEGGGKVLIPAFALGRAQELLLILSEFRRKGELAPVRVWADGMARAMCQAYTSFPEALPLLLQERGAGFFDELTRPVETNQQRNTLIWQADPAVIVASSGMLAGGPSLTYARALAGKPQHAILLTGYQDEEAPGRRLQELASRGKGSIWLGKDKVDVQCRIGTYSLSAHADEGQLISFAETLDPGEIILVHGDDQARASLEKAFKSRTRPVHLPHAGQTLEFTFAPRLRSRQHAIGKKRPLDVETLWKEVTTPAGGLFLGRELAETWWGEQWEDYLPLLEEQLARNDLYFAPDPVRKGLYRAHTPETVERSLRRREQMEKLLPLEARWLAVQGGSGKPELVRCLGARPDRCHVEGEDGAQYTIWPEDILEVFGEAKPDIAMLAEIEQPDQTALSTWMEPNQALSFANKIFPAEAHLRRSGYRLDERKLILTFDFPETAPHRYQEEIQNLEKVTGWKVEVNRDTNQGALNSLARAVLPEGWQIQKGPAIYRDQKLVGITVRPQPGSDAEQAVQTASDAFKQASGFDLNITIAGELQGKASAEKSTVGPIGSQRMEINAAFAVIKQELAGTSLYRTSLHGDEILLSFISPQVGERYRETINALAERTGWSLAINPNTNQGLILEEVKSTLTRAGIAIQKGPGLFPERNEVSIVLAESPDPVLLQEIEETIWEKTGFQLAAAAASTPSQPKEKKQEPAGDQAEIPVERIRLSRYYQGLSLDPQKLERSVERFRRMGYISPPIKVRRMSDGYLLLDGLYRLRVAQKLGLEKILAEIE
jgi:hypothetical protein